VSVDADRAVPGSTSAHRGVGGTLPEHRSDPDRHNQPVSSATRPKTPPPSGHQGHAVGVLPQQERLGPMIPPEATVGTKGCKCKDAKIVVFSNRTIEARNLQ